MLKNLLELNRPDDQLFEAEIFEARNSIGGLWAYSDNVDIPTALTTTLGNACKWRNCYADFPVDEAFGYEAPVYLDQKEMLTYLEKYADKFDLRPHIRLGVRVINVERLSEENKWLLFIKDQTTGKVEAKKYDKVIEACGRFSVPRMPKIQGIERFRGIVIHSGAYKNRQQFQGKRVLILGFGISAAETAVELVGHANTIYLSHRRGNTIFGRVVNKKPLDLFRSRRAFTFQNVVKLVSPSTFATMSAKTIDGFMEDGAKGRIKPEWNIRPTPSLTFTRPIICDTLIDNLDRGTISSVASIRQVVSDSTVELADGSTVDVDAIILCTGYSRASIMSQFVQTNGSPALPHLFHNTFTPEHGAALAITSSWWLPTGICEVADALGMAVAQVFAGHSRLPSVAQMERQIASRHAALRAMAAAEATPPGADAMEILVDEGPFRAFVNDMAKTGVNEMLGYGLEGWSFWWRERELCEMLMAGIDSPHIHRLFEPPPETRRKRWPGARAAIEVANEQLRIFMEKSDEEQAQLIARDTAERYKSLPVDNRICLNSRQESSASL